MENNATESYNIEFDELGSVKISSDVVSAVATLAAKEVNGIASLSPVTGQLGDLLSKKSHKGVRCELKDKTVAIDMYVVIEYGAHIPAVAKKLQERIKSSVETMTGLSVKSVDIYVQAVDIPSDTPPGTQA